VMPRTLNAPGPSAATRTPVPVWLCDRPAPNCETACD
jgi:hypothetical protein